MASRKTRGAPPTLESQASVPAVRPDAICLDCRRVLAPGETCGVERPHRTIVLTTIRGRELLRDEVWGPERHRRQLMHRVGQLALGGCLAGVGWIIAEWGLGWRSELLGVGLIVLGLGVQLVERRVRRHFLMRPRGARTLPTVRVRGETREGEVALAGEAVVAPLTGRPCVAWSITLVVDHVSDGTQVTCRQAWSTGFDVVAADGARLRVPAGRVLFHPDPGSGRQVDGRALGQHLETMVGERWTVSGLEFPLFPAGRAWEEILAAGDRVRVSGRLELREAEGPRGLPRERAAMTAHVLAPASIEKLGPAAREGGA